ENALNIRKVSLGEEHAATIAILKDLAIMLWEVGDLSSAHRYLSEAIDHFRKTTTHTLHGLPRREKLLLSQQRDLYAFMYFSFPQEFVSAKDAYTLHRERRNLVLDLEIGANVSPATNDSNIKRLVDRRKEIVTLRTNLEYGRGHNKINLVDRMKEAAA